MAINLKGISRSLLVTTILAIIGLGIGGIGLYATLHELESKVTINISNKKQNKLLLVCKKYLNLQFEKSKD